MCSTYNEGESVVAKRFIKVLKSKIYKTLTANDTKSYLGYLNKLVDQCYNTYHHSISKKAVDTDYSALTEEIEFSHKAPKIKVGERVRITKYKKILRKILSLSKLMN